MPVAMQLKQEFIPVLSVSLDDTSSVIIYSQLGKKQLKIIILLLRRMIASR